MASSALNWALYMASLGYHVHPVGIQLCLTSSGQLRKQPTGLPGGWQLGGLLDPAAIRARWSQVRASGYLIACGPSGITGVDTDIKGDGETNWLAAGGIEHAAFEVLTWSGGKHRIFRSTGAHNSAGHPKGVDVRGVDGGLFGPGSVVLGLDGSIAGVYSALAGSAVREHLTPEPTNLAQIVGAVHRRADTGIWVRSAFDAMLTPPKTFTHSSAMAKCREHLAKIEALDKNAEGAGNRIVIYTAAFTLGGIIGSGADAVGDYAQASTALCAACAKVWGHADDDDERWIEDGLTDGIKKPLIVVPDPPAVQSKTEIPAGGSSESTIIGGATFLGSVNTDEPPLWGDADTCLWAPGEPVMFVGPPGVGKSTLAHLVVWGVLGFIPSVLGYPVRSDGRRVLYLAMDRPKQIARAMRRLTVPVSAEVFEDRLRVQRGPLPVGFTQEPDWILNRAVELDAGTVVIDSIKDLLPDPSDPVTASVYNAARQRCLAAGIEWIELHHNRKRTGGNAEPKTLDDVYGNRWITAGAGSVLSLYGEPGDTVVHLSQIKTPSGELFPKYIAIDKATGGMALHESVTLEAVLGGAGMLGVSVRDAAVAVYAVKKPSKSNIESVRVRFARMAKKGELEAIDVSGETRYRPVSA